MTCAIATDILRRAARDRSARNSWINPSTPLRKTMAMMAAASSQSSSKPDKTAAPIKTHTITLVNWERNSFRGEAGGASGSSLNPSCLWRCTASSASRPSPRSVEIAAATSCGDSVP